MSTLSWIDVKNAEHRRAQRIIVPFQEWKIRSELGMGDLM